MSIIEFFNSSPFIISALSRLKDESAHLKIDNLQGFSLPLFLYSTAAVMPLPFLVILPDMDLINRLEEELAFINSVEGKKLAIEVFPDYDLPEINNPSVMRDVRCRRLRVLDRIYRMANFSQMILLTTHSAVIRRTLSREQYLDRTREIEVGDKINIEELMNFLAAVGYEPSAAVEREGQFSRRGGLIDVFPPTVDAPVRIEFIGNKVEAIRPFNVETQRSRTRVKQAVLAPAWEAAEYPSVPPDWMRADHKEFISHKVSFDGAILYPEIFSASTIIYNEISPARVIIVDSDDVREKFNEKIERDETFLTKDGFAAPQEILKGIYNFEHANDLQANPVFIDTRPNETDDEGAAPLRRLPPLPLDLNSIASILRDECKKAKVLIVSRYRRRLEHFLEQEGIFPSAMWEGDVQGGFHLDDVPLALFADSEIFLRRPHTPV
ncbi:MAG: hypothetical protein AB1546_05060, partial [bacterium]